MAPLPFKSRLEKSVPMELSSASTPRSCIALENSSFHTSPDMASSRWRKSSRSGSRFLWRIERSCSETGKSPSASVRISLVRGSSTVSGGGGGSLVAGGRAGSSRGWLLVLRTIRSASSTYAIVSFSSGCKREKRAATSSGALSSPSRPSARWNSAPETRPTACLSARSSAVITLSLCAKTAVRSWSGRVSSAAGSKWVVANVSSSPGSSV
mmetsp:Transcript_21691/g.52111  ORF Transcript_21691/g.52111 Transcript_21691/m.52111 type:complete len:211 (+) Transcript_21691:1805-2437(+)